MCHGQVDVTNKDVSVPFSAKFSKKLRFVNNLAELAQLVPLEQLSIPDRVKQ